MYNFCLVTLTLESTYKLVVTLEVRRKEIVVVIITAVRNGYECVTV